MLTTLFANFTMELRPTLWQRILAFVVFGGMAFLSVAAILQICLPSHSIFGNQGQPGDSPLWPGLLLAFSLYWWWRTENYLLVATAESLTQRAGFFAKMVKWQDVAFYQLELLRGTRERKIEPVLYNCHGKVILRPIAPTFVGTRRMDEERAAFWQFVETQLPGKKSEA